MADMHALNPHQEQAIVALLSEPTIALAAKKAGVGACCQRLLTFVDFLPKCEVL